MWISNTNFFYVNQQRALLRDDKTINPPNAYPGNLFQAAQDRKLWCTLIGIPVHYDAHIGTYPFKHSHTMDN